jgi:hypothetical protein
VTIMVNVSTSALSGYSYSHMKFHVGGWERSRNNCVLCSWHYHGTIDQGHLVVLSISDYSSPRAAHLIDLNARSSIAWVPSSNSSSSLSHLKFLEHPITVSSATKLWNNYSRVYRAAVAIAHLQCIKSRSVTLARTTLGNKLTKRTGFA